MALALPDDVWLHIADRAAAAALSHVCGRLWELLRLRHVRTRSLHRRQLYTLLEELAAQPTEVHSLSLAFAGEEPPLSGVPAAFGALGRLHCLAQLRLHLGTCRLTKSDAISLYCIGDLVHVRDLTLGLAMNGLHRQGLGILMAVQKMPAVRTLHVDFENNFLGPDVADAVAALHSMPELTSLYVDLSHNRVGIGTPRLAGLQAARRLKSLTLRLWRNGVDDGGAEALAELRNCPHLQQLSLDLSCNLISDHGARQLALLRHGRVLGQLSLDLCANKVHDDGAQGLERLAEGGALCSVAIFLANNCIGDAGAEALLRLSHCPAFHTCILDLSGNCYTPQFEDHERLQLARSTSKVLL